MIVAQDVVRRYNSFHVHTAQYGWKLTQSEALNLISVAVVDQEESIIESDPVLLVFTINGTSYNMTCC
jgi:hypothetical protein